MDRSKRAVMSEMSDLSGLSENGCFVLNVRF
nr:MAG TPA: hypothetical protein [Caudoviricetes sp.]